MLTQYNQSERKQSHVSNTSKSDDRTLLLQFFPEAQLESLTPIKRSLRATGLRSVEEHTFILIIVIDIL